ncbi:hypothetical protein Bbelb_350160 [Branchiostoma belcheri]|nr:hypothetical protein Bbelb_350160 [Branchiostoma belcheri]
MRLRIEQQISDLQKKKIKSLQDCRRKLDLKLEKVQAEKQQVQEDLEATMADGKYTDDIREVVMDLLTSGVSMNKVDGIIHTVLQKLANVSVDRLPSKGLKSRLLVEAKILGQRQIAEAIISGDSDIGNCLHQDGTSKFFKKYLTFDVSLPSGRTLTMSMTEVPPGDAEGILSAFSESCRELAEVLCDAGEDVAQKTAEIITSFTSTMSDRGATNPLFNRYLEEMRRELLPTAKKEWDTLPDDVKDQLETMCNYFCKMHLLVNFATEANATLKIFQDAVAEGRIGDCKTDSDRFYTRLSPRVKTIFQQYRYDVDNFHRRNRVYRAISGLLTYGLRRGPPGTYYIYDQDLLDIVRDTYPSGEDVAWMLTNQDNRPTKEVGVGDLFDDKTTQRQHVQKDLYSPFDDPGSVHLWTDWYLAMEKSYED